MSVTSTDATQGSLYEKQSKIYPHKTTGVFARLRKTAMFVLLGLFYGVVWLTWDDRQAVLFDLPARQFHIFGLTLWPQDFIYLALLLLILALTLFFVTAIAGRLWCGYACPQTVWTEAFLMIERWTEGSRNQRMKLDRAPMSVEKFARKSSKQFLWVTLSFWTGMTFVGYFVPVRELVPEALAGAAHPWTYFWWFFYGFATYGNAGFLREQVCKYMCPYARFQSAMFDRDTLIVAYDEQRGEPRGKRRSGSAPLGDCVDCTLCVQVRPTGIDIRDGLQYECIACAACVDVCNTVMAKKGFEPNLVRYTTQNADEGRPSRVIRLRTVLYAALLAVLVVGLITSIATRVPVRMEVIRDRNSLYRPVADLSIENVYTIRAVNMTDQAQGYELSVVSDVDFVINAPELIIPATQSRAFVIRLSAPQSAGIGRENVRFELRAVDDPTIHIERDSAFFFPLEQTR